MPDLSSECCHYKELDAIYWKLPDYPKALFGIFSVFSAENGLFGIGGSDDAVVNTVYNLSFDHENIQKTNQEWRWEEIARMSDCRCYASCAMIKTKEHRQKLIVVAGATGEEFNGCKKICSLKIGSTHIEDQNVNESWEKLKDCNTARYYAGIGYDEYLQRLYIGGGVDEAVQKVEYYDIEKNLWIDLPDTQNNYTRYPSVSVADHNRLQVAYNNYMECIDLRENKKTWTVVEDSLCERFGIILSSSISGNKQWMIHS